MKTSYQLMKELAEKISEETSDAYSFDRYTNWKACVMFLLKHGMNEVETEEILRSKWMRWAGDGSRHVYGKCNSNDLKKFMDKLVVRDFEDLNIRDAYFVYSNNRNKENSQ